MSKEKTFLNKVKSYFNQNNKKIVSNNQNKRGYDAGKENNGSVFYGSIKTTEDGDLYTSLANIKELSRKMYKNNPIYKHYVDTHVEQIVGIGFKVKVNGFDNNNVIDSAGSEVVHESFLDWSDNKCDVTGKLDFVDIQKILATTLMIDGEVLYKKIRDASSEENPFGYQIQLLDTARIATELNTVLSNSVIRMGIEMNSYGRTIAIWIRKKINLSNNEMYGYLLEDYERIKREDIEYEFIQKHPEQTRGVPDSHAILNNLKEQDEVNQAIQMYLKLSAATGIYLERKTGAKIEDIASFEDKNGNFYATMGVGEVMSLPANTEMKSFKGEMDSGALEVFNRRRAQEISAGVNMSHLSLYNDTSDLNYFTSKTIKAAEREYYKNLQEFFKKILKEIYKDWLKQALLNSKIRFNNGSPIRFDKYKKFSNHTWIATKKEVFDELEEVEIFKEKYRLGLITLSEYLAENGKDLIEQLSLMKQEKELINKMLGSDFIVTSFDPEINNSSTTYNEIIEQRKKLVNEIIRDKK